MSTRACAPPCANVFAKLAVNLGDTRVRKIAEDFGFNAPKRRIPLSVTTSVYPDVSNTKETAFAGLGQFEVTATPFQMAVVAAVLANGGKLAPPHLVSKLTDSSGEVLDRPSTGDAKRAVSPYTAAQLREAMTTAIENGPGAAAHLSHTTVGGKTGQATSSDPNRPAPYGWFVSYALPDGDGRKVAVAVLLDSGNRTGADTATAAAKVARETMRAALEK